MKKNNSSRLSFKVRAFTLFLAIWILVGMIPSTALSLGTESSSDNTDVNSDPIVNSSSDSGTAAVTTAYIDTSVEVIPNEDYNESEIVTVREDESLREENVKHFDIGGGVYRAVSYSYPVHRKDSEGKWQDIDNTLTLQTADKKSSYKTADLRLEFAQAFSKNEKIFTLSENGYSLSMTLTAEDNNNNLVQRAIGSSNNNITAKSASVENHKVRSKTFLGEDVEEQIENAVKIDNKTKVKYEDVSENVDIEYIIEYNDIKENIIVNAVCDSYVYTFSLETEGLVAAMGEDGAVYLSDDETKELIYIIPAPYMYDARGEYSFDVSYTLKDEGEGEYSLTVTADKTWINSSERVFPVTIDPTVTTNTYTYDTFIDADSPNSANGSSTLIYVETNKKIVFIHIQKPTLPSVATINSATMHVPYRFDEESGRADLAAYQVAMNWNENTLTWNAASATTNLSAPRPVRMGYYTAALSYPTFNASSTYPMTAAVNITAAAQRWYAGTDNNFGIALVRVSGTLDLVTIYTNRYNYASYMTVDYTWNYLPDGVYAIKSVGNPGYYMNVNASSAITSGTLEKAQYTTSPTTTFTRPALFKITRVVDSNGVSRYIIRSMVNNLYGVWEYGYNVITTPIATSDAAVSQNQMFTLEHNYENDAFYIKSATSQYVISANDSNAALIMTTRSAATSQALWQFVQYTGAHKQGMTINYPTSWGSIGHIVGTTGNITPAGWSTYIDSNTVSIEVDSGCVDLGSLSLNQNENNVALHALNSGRIRINYEIQKSSGTVTFSGYGYVRIVPQEGTYYIQNAGTEKYVDLEGPSTSSGAAIQQWQYHTGHQAKWNVEHVPNSGGYVRLKSVYSNLYIGVDSNNTTMIKQYGMQNDYTLWKIDRSERGNLIFTCKATESSGSVLATLLYNNSNGDNLTQVVHTNDSSCNDEWYIVTKVISCVNYYDSSFVGNTQLIQNIATANSFANMVYSRYYNIGIYMDGVATQYATVIDNCLTGTNSSCSDELCGTYCSVHHHKNIRTISDQLYNDSREDDHIYTLWTNRSFGTYCYDVNGEHDIVDYIAVTYGKRPVIHFMTISGSSMLQLIGMSMGLAHEISHVFNMDDVYDNEGHDVERKTICIMERFEGLFINDFFSGVKNNTKKPFCPSCHEAMKTFTSNIVISGN